MASQMPSSHSRTIQQLNHRVAKSRTACTSCRQVKLRCDGAQNFPASCSRCLKNNLQCRTDPTFKRVRTKQRLDEMNRELNALKNSIPQDSIPLIGKESTTPTGSTATMNRDVQPIICDTFYFMSSVGDVPEFASLGDNSLEPDEIVALFTHFESNYYRHCPILNTSMSVATLYRLSPLLFWTIVIISARCHPSHNSKYDELVDDYRVLLERTLMGRLIDIEPIQAGILLCFWPLHVQKQIYDPSWNYCGLLTNAAIKLGFHRIGAHGRDRGSVGNFRMKAKTWMACCFINYSHIWYTGASGSIEISNSLRAISPLHTTAEQDFVTKICVLKQYAKAASTLENLVEHTDHQIIQILCKELENFRDDHRDFWNIETDMIFLASKLSIYTHQLELSIQKDADVGRHLNREAEASSDILVNIALRLASSLITAFTDLTTTNTSTNCSNDSSPQRYLPKYYFQMLLLSSMLGFKISALNPDAISGSYALAQNQIQQTYHILRAWSTKENDEPSRASRVVDVLSNAQREGRLKLRQSGAGSGPGITLLTDAIVTSKVLRGEDIKEYVGRDGFSELDGNLNATLSIQTQLPPGEGEIAANSPNLADGAEASYTMPSDTIPDIFLDWNLSWGLDSYGSQDFGTYMHENGYI